LPIWVTPLGLVTWPMATQPMMTVSLVSLLVPLMMPVFLSTVMPLNWA
jgi:hypothetical protein